MPLAIVNCDWGTSRLRLRTVRLDRWQVTAEFRSLDGVASLAESYAPADRPRAYRSLLLEGLRPLITDQPELLAAAPILISGMASSSIGWHELPYAGVPLPVDGSGLTWHDLEPLESTLGLHRVVLVSGACSDVDVMRGEETELVGLFTLPQAQGLADSTLVIKPGTHSKHLLVRDGRLVSFQTFMTGELFDVLARHSILQHSVSKPDAEHAVADDAALRAGVRATSALPLGAALFRVRTRQLLDHALPGENREFLSGVLLGAELGYLTASHDQTPLVLCASMPLFVPYRAALEELGLAGRLTLISPEETELLSARGQAAVWSRIAAS
jgi:2-dehydro-3-deoxygalactonokinase